MEIAKLRLVWLWNLLPTFYSSDSVTFRLVHPEKWSKLCLVLGTLLSRPFHTCPLSSGGQFAPRNKNEGHLQHGCSSGWAVADGAADGAGW